MENPDKKKGKNRRKKPQGGGGEAPRQPEAGPSGQKANVPPRQSERSVEAVSKTLEATRIQQKNPGKGQKKNKQQQQESGQPQQITRPIGQGGPPGQIWAPRPSGPPGQRASEETGFMQQTGPPGQFWGQQPTGPPGPQWQQQRTGPPGQFWGQQPTGPPGPQWQQQPTEHPGRTWGQQPTMPPGQDWRQQPTGHPGLQFQQQPTGSPEHVRAQQPTGPPGQDWRQQPTGYPGLQFQQQPTGSPGQDWRQQPTGYPELQFQQQPTGSPEHVRAQQPTGPPGQDWRQQPTGPPEHVRAQQPTKPQERAESSEQSVPAGAAQQHQEQKPQVQPEGAKGKKQSKPKGSDQTQKPQTSRETSQTPRPQAEPAQKPSPRDSPRQGPEIALSAYKGPGTLGRPVKFEANYVFLNFSKLKDVAYHYDVAIDPDRPKKLLSVVFEQFRQKHFPNMSMAFDRMKNAYSIVRLNLPRGGLSDEIEIDDREMSRKKTFKVAIQETEDQEVRMSLLKTKKAYMEEKDRGKVARALQCLEIVLRMAATGGIHVGRQFYWRPERPVTLDGVMELWTGIYHSAVFGARPLMNVDVTNKGFPIAMSVLDVMRESRIDLNRPDTRYMENVRSHLNGLNISYAPKGNEASRRVYKFLGFRGPATTETFIHDGQKKTVEQYFKSMNMALRYPYLPLLHVGPRDKNIYLPAEFCSIPGGQAVMKKLTDMQTRSMIKHTATSTDERKRRILEILRKTNFNASTVVKDFGVGVEDNFVNVDARILEAPKLEYAGRKFEAPRDGVWQMRSKQFIVPTSIDEWAVLVLEGRPNFVKIDDFVKSLISAGQALNMRIAKPRSMDQVDMRRYVEFTKKMEAWKGKVKMVLVVIPDFGNVYQKVKRAAETEYGILTQCIKHTTIDRRGDLSTVNNLLLKINSKLNGLNHRIMSNLKLGVLKDAQFMVVGADVTHPSPDQRNIPSIVGMASSYDEDGFRYTGMWRIQDPRREMIDDLAQMIHDHLIYFKKERKGVLPKTILYYRDGVGEGDFQRVLNLEFTAIHKGAARVQANYKPNVVFIVVQKRHHTRFFPGKSGISVGRNNNVPPGTIVDTGIVPAEQNQFFLVAHQAIQGVAKPTKYCVLVDEANISMDELQALTYNLCHMFTRCNRAVSYVAPTYYAHLMAARGKVYVEGDNLNMDRLDAEYKKRLIKDEVHKNHPMFFV